MHALLINIFVVLCLMLSACSAKQGDKDTVKTHKDDGGSSGSEVMLAKDAAIPAPNLPPALAAEAADDPDPTNAHKGRAIAYFVKAYAPKAPELTDSFNKISLLQRLANTPPDTMTGLEQRLYVSLEEGRDILKSYGYYSGKISGRIGDAMPESMDPSMDPALDSQIGQSVAASDQSSSATGPEKVNSASETSGGQGDNNPTDEQNNGAKHAGKIQVNVFFEPGPQYLLGRNAITTVGPLRPSDDKSRKYPESLADVGLPQGSPAIADNITAAVDRARDSFQNLGYPFAEIDATRYILDHEKRELEADVRVNEGEFVRMGNIKINGESSVAMSYLEALRTWEPGAPWSRDNVEAYQEKLRQSGLFRSITLAPAAQTDANGQRDITTTLAPAPERTISAELKYDSDFGPGVQAGWEHRNLSGRGDNLRIAMPLWQDMQEFTGKYRLPYFLRNDQAFLAQGGVLHQKTDAYEISSAAAASGLEKRFSQNWTGSAQVSAEGGSLKDSGAARRDYSLFGLPLALSYDNTGSLLDAVNGLRVNAALTPYTGKYGKDFTTARSRLDTYFFLPLVGPDKLVMAMRGTYGAMWSGNSVKAADVPTSVRFYSGGGGSVRGYKYQSLGPRNNGDDPLGGSSLLEMSAESRWKITKEWGLVAFVDGGMAYDDDQRLGQDLRWGAGLGIRYYTAIGPVRVDVATPLNPRKDDPSMQFYISIGQSF